MKSKRAPQISVVIPTLNGNATIAACLDGIFHQTIRDDLQVVLIDSGSRDGTLDIVRRYPVRLLQIESHDFNHGSVRNLGANVAQSEFVAMTVQDARPVDEFWLERMLRHFERPEVGGVCGQQIVPHEPDKNPLQWFRPYNKPEPRKIWFRDREEFESLPPREQLALCSWDDVTAMYRREALLRIPFRPVSFAEDMVWARDALLAGEALVYDYSARVYHYHEESFRFRLRRTYTIQYHAHQVFGAAPAIEPLFLELARHVHRASHRKYCASRCWHWMAYNIRLTLSEWLAARIFWVVSKLGRSRLGARINSWFCSEVPHAQRRDSTQLISTGDYLNQSTEAGRRQ